VGLKKKIAMIQPGMIVQHFYNKARLGRLIAAVYEKGESNQPSIMPLIKLKIRIIKIFRRKCLN
jgi:hypothetical protein